MHRKFLTVQNWPRFFLSLGLSFVAFFMSVFVISQTEWFTVEPGLGEAVLAAIALALTALVFWIGRRRPLLSVPCALAFLLLTATAIPNALPARPTAQRIVCINNLKAIAGAKSQWATLNHKGPSDVPSVTDLCDSTGTNIILLRQMPTCPQGGTYEIRSVSENPTCSLSNKGHRLE